MNIIRFNSTNKEYLKQAFQIRKSVFMQEMGVSAEDEFEYDDESTHYLLFDKAEAVACCRWRETQKGIKLERFAVLKSYRSKGLGKMILKHILAELLPLKKPIYLYAQTEALPFYQKNGFIAKGEEFMDAGIRHLQMEYICK